MAPRGGSTPIDPSKKAARKKVATDVSKAIDIDKSSDVEIVQQKGMPPTSSSSTTPAAGRTTRKKRDSGHSIAEPSLSRNDGKPTSSTSSTSASTSKKKRKAQTSPEISDALTDLEDLEAPSSANDKSKGKSKAKGKSRANKKKKGDAVEDDEEAEVAKPKRKRVNKKDQTHLPVVQYPERHWESKKMVGAHVSIAEGAHYAPHRALLIGAKAFGMFTKTQKAWKGPPLSEASLRLFPLRCKGKTETEPDEDNQVKLTSLGDKRGFDPTKHIVPHGSYLTNLCNPDPEKRKKSYENLLDELKRAEDLGIGLFNIHPGTSTGACTREEAINFLAGCLNDAHKVTKSIVILLENMAGNVIGGKHEDLGDVIALIEDKTRVGVCYDTCHGFAGGYDMRTEEAYKATFDDFEKVVGIKYIKAFHLNDSREGLGKHRDLHENIGAGELGILAFQMLMHDKRFDDLPMILETPMISGSLKVEASPSKRATAGSSSNGKAKVEVTDVKLGGDKEQQPNKQEEGGQETALTLGGSTWKREIELLHELEKVPIGQTNERIDTLHAEILAIVADSKAKSDATKEQKKAEKAAAKAANEKVKKGKKGGDEDEGEADELASDASEEEAPKKKAQGKGGRKKVKVEKGCDSHDEMGE